MNDNHVALADYGLASYSDHLGHVSSDIAKITITYRPPELFNKRHFTFSRSSDIWSFGKLALYLFMETSHIFDSDPKERHIKSKLLRLMDDTNRRTTLDNYLSQKIPILADRTIVINFLDRILLLNPSKRSSTQELLDDPIFKSTQISMPPIPSGTSIYPLTWVHPPEEIGIEGYFSIEYMIRLMININPKIETFFIAIDMFHRSLAHLYMIYNHFKDFENGYTLTDMLSLGALTAVWIAVKANQDENYTALKMSKITDGHYSPETILKIERHIIIGLKGIIYRWNPFKEARSKQDLSTLFEEVTNLFRYPHRVPRVNSQQCFYKENLYQLTFNSIYRESVFCNEAVKSDSETHMQYRYKRDRTEYFHNNQSRSNRLTSSPSFNLSSI